MIKIHQTIGRIAGKVNDYIICKYCKSINWYENEECISCELSFKDKENFREMTEKDGEKLLKEYDKDNLDVDSCELDVWGEKMNKEVIIEKIIGGYLFTYPDGKKAFEKTDS